MNPTLEAAPGTASRPRILTDLARSDLFAGVPPEALAKLSNHAWSRSFRLGEHVFETGQAASVFTIVKQGVVKIVNTGAAGEDCILGVFGARQSIGTSAATRASVYQAAACAITERVDVVRIDARRVLKAARENAEVATALNRALLAHSEVLRAKIAIMSAPTVPQRLAKLFLALADRFGEGAERGRLVLSVALSKLDLAGLTGASAEAVLRVVSAWERAGILGLLQHGYVILRPQALRSLSEGFLREA